MPVGPVNAVTEDELRDVVSTYWVIDDIRPARIHAHVPEAFAQNFTEFAGENIRDEAGGRKSVGAWLLSAHLG
jgi:2-heptyl-1-hydroxyquinolin-4(1H)-one methyltransferase